MRKFSFFFHSNYYQRLLFVLFILLLETSTLFVSAKTENNQHLTRNYFQNKQLLESSDNQPLRKKPYLIFREEDDSKQRRYSSNQLKQNRTPFEAEKLSKLTEQLTGKKRPKFEPPPFLPEELKYQETEEERYLRHRRQVAYQTLLKKVNDGKVSNPNAAEILSKILNQVEKQEKGKDHLPEDTQRREIPKYEPHIPNLSSQPTNNNNNNLQTPKQETISLPPKYEAKYPKEEGLLLKEELKSKEQMKFKEDPKKQEEKKVEKKEKLGNENKQKQEKNNMEPKSGSSITLFNELQQSGLYFVSAFVFTCLGLYLGGKFVFRITTKSQKTEKISLKDLTVDQVFELIEELNLGQYKSTFKKNRIDGLALMELTEEKLIQLGMKEMGLRMLLLRFLKNPVLPKQMNFTPKKSKIKN